MKLIFILIIGINFVEYLRTQECSAKYDPYITTFDHMQYGFQYDGDHFIMYDDFKNTRVTSGFQKCFYGSCTCAVYVQKNRKLIFVDFCNVQNYASPTSKVYGVSVEQNFIGPKAIREVPTCPFISPLHENNKQTWDSIPTILESFKCARLQGSSFYTYYLIRTVENHFEDSLLVKFQLKNRGMPILTIKAPNSANRSTGGLCGRWDGKQDTDLYVLDRHGVESFVSVSNLTLIRDFWNLNSVYNKQSGHSKRCAECMLMSERSFYCPCDDFNLFDQNNYNLPPNRLNYCKVPMHACVEKYFNIQTSDQNISSSTSDFLSSTQFPSQTSSIPNPIKFEEAYDICWTSFINHSGLNKSLFSGCLDRNATIQFCINDVTLSSDPSIVKIHIESSIDMTIQNILTNQSNCDLEDLQMLCPNGCSGNGVCKFEQRCLLPGLINQNCSYPVKCECKQPFGGNDCSQDLTNIAELTISPQFCDLRTKNCSLINGFGYPFSTRDPIFVKLEYIEYDIYNGEHILTETSVADTITDNNILIELFSINSLNLYKNIHSIEADFVSRDSLAYIRIYISYSNESFVQWANVTLYDSKCRTEDKENGQLVFWNDRCDIEGVCYIRNQTSQTNAYLICNPDESIHSWTLISTPDPLCNGKNAWTKWYNFDSPDTDGGDFELYGDYKYGCKYPSVVQARTVEGIDANQTGQVNWLVPLYGFFCFNRENENECADYEIRQCCDISELDTFSTETSTSKTENLETSKTSNFVSSNPTKPSTLTTQNEATLSQKSSTIYFNGTVKLNISISDDYQKILPLPNGDLVRGSTGNLFEVWDLQNGKIKRNLSSVQYFGPNHFGLLSNGDLVAGYNYNGTLLVWDLNETNGEPLKRIIQTNKSIQRLTVLKNDDLAIVNFYDYSGVDYVNYIIIRDSHKGLIKKKLEQHESFILQIIELPNGNLVSCSLDYTVKIWNISNGAVIKTIYHTRRVFSITFLPNGYLVSGLDDGTINIWNLESNQLIRNLTGHKDFICENNCLHVLANGDLLSGSNDGTIKVWNPYDGTLKFTSSLHKSNVYQLAVLSNGNLISSSRTEIIVWN